MNSALTVLLNDRVAGTLTRLPGGRLRFDYDDSYRTSRSVTPLSLSMPAQVRSHSDHVVKPWLWNLLPDNEAVLGRWARQFHASASSPFSLLAAPIGQDCAGAVRFVSPEHVEQAIGRTGEVQWLTEDQVAERLRERQDWVLMRVAGAVLVHTAATVPVIISLIIATRTASPGLPRTRPGGCARPGLRWDARTPAPAHRSDRNLVLRSQPAASRHCRTRADWRLFAHLLSECRPRSAISVGLWARCMNRTSTRDAVQGRQLGRWFGLCPAQGSLQYSLVSRCWELRRLG